MSTTRVSSRTPARTRSAGLVAAMALAMMATAFGASASVAADDSSPADPIGAQFWGDVLAVGDCIIRPAEGELPEPFSCDELHEEEIYAIGRLDFGPDEPYPGEVIGDMTGEQLCDAATAEFGGEAWDRLPFVTYWLYPTEAEWDAGDRSIMCSAAPPDGIDLKIGTAAGGSLDSDDVLLARGGFASPELGEITEWVAVEEHDTIASVGVVSAGQFDVPRRRAWAVPQGFLFDATARGDASPATTTWGYTWESGEFSDLGSILPDWELSSTMSMNGIMVFAARETSDDDWDLFSASSEDGTQAIADGPGHQRYPTFTPDGKQVLFHDDGDLVVIDVDGSNRRVLVERASNAYESAVSPDGTQVAFASDHAGNDDIWLIDFDGGEPLNLTDHPGNEAWPTWSAGGDRIYFSSTRLRPESRVGSLMMMDADGSDASWFSGASVGQAFVVDRAVADSAFKDLLTIDELYYYEPVEGEPGTTASWQHSSGRLSADLPAGWRVSELDEGVGFVVAPRPARFYELWEADGIVVTLHDDLSSGELIALSEETVAAQSCQRADAAATIQPLDDLALGSVADYLCGDEGAVATVATLYDDQAGAGVLIEAQRDDLPDADADRENLEVIIGSLAWG